jgi:hypothetical protein
MAERAPDPGPVEPVAGERHGEAVTPEFAAATRVTFSAMIVFDALDDEQQRRVVLPFDSPNRLHWNFLPEAGRGRYGLPLRALTHEQSLLVHRLVASSMSIEAYGRVLMALALEHVLRELDQPRLGYVATDFRDPGAYYLTFFGEPGADRTWGWRLVGHHVSLNVTVCGQDVIASTPFMLGAEPGEVGPLRPLAREEDLGFALLAALTPAERERAIFHPLSPPDFATRVVPVLGERHEPQLHGDARRDALITPRDAAALAYVRDAPRGIAAGDLGPAARALFDELLETYVGRVAPRMLAYERARLATGGLDAIHFGWAGGTEPGQGHYYRLQGPTTLVEFNNTEGQANHVHTVWRDPARDFGLDLLPR